MRAFLATLLLLVASPAAAQVTIPPGGGGVPPPECTSVQLLARTGNCSVLTPDVNEFAVVTDSNGFNCEAGGGVTRLLCGYDALAMSWQAVARITQQCSPGDFVIGQNETGLLCATPPSGGSSTFLALTDTFSAYTLGDYVKQSAVGLDSVAPATVRTDIGANDAGNLDTGTVDPGRVGAGHIDAMSEIAAGIKRGPGTGTHLLTTSSTPPVASETTQMDPDGIVRPSGFTPHDLPPVFAGPGADGLVPDPGASTARYLDDSGAWSFPVVAAGEYLFTQVRSTVAITVGDAVYIDGFHPGTNLATVNLAQADAEATSQVLGFALDTVSANTIFDVLVSGKVTDIDTAAFSVSDDIYLSPTVAGGVQNTRPVYPSIPVRLGEVLRSHASQGAAQVDVDHKLTKVGDIQATGADGTKFLRDDGVWTSPAGSGDVVGPASAVDSGICLFDGTTGKLIQDSGVTLTKVGQTVTLDIPDALDTTLRVSNSLGGNITLETDPHPDPVSSLDDEDTTGITDDVGYTGQATTVTAGQEDTDMELFHYVNGAKVIKIRLDGSNGDLKLGPLEGANYPQIDAITGNLQFLGAAGAQLGDSSTASTPPVGDNDSTVPNTGWVQGELPEWVDTVNIADVDAYNTTFNGYTCFSSLNRTITFARVRGYARTGSVDVQLQEKTPAQAAQGLAGTAILTAALTINGDATEDATTSFSNATIAARNYACVVVSALTTSPDFISVSIEATY